MLHAAQRIVANAITTALREGWRTTITDLNHHDPHPRSARANHNPAAQTDPTLHRTLSRIHGPSTLTDTWIWGITDPDLELQVPPLSWLLTMAAYNDALDRLGPSLRVHHFDFLNATPPSQPFRRHRNRHGTRIMRRAEGVTREVMHAALTVASHTIVHMLTESQYREAFPLVS